MITIFDVLIGDDWTSIMFNCIRAKGLGVSIYFILLVIMGTIILMNLFLAIMLGNFDKARNFGQKKQLLDAFNELLNQRDGSKIEIDWACDIILGDLSDHAKYKVLKLYNMKAGEKKINRTKKKIVECNDNIIKGIATKEELDELEDLLE